MSIRHAYQDRKKSSSTGFADMSVILKSLSPATKSSKNTTLSAAAFSLRPVVRPAPPQASDIDTWQYVLYLMSCLKRKDPPSEEQVSNVLASMYYIAYPDLLNSLVGTSLIISPFSDEEWEKIKAYPSAAAAASDQYRTDAKASYREVSSGYGVAEFPYPGYMPGGSGRAPMKFLAFYGYLGVIAFTLTKDASQTGKDALTIARPRALLSKYGWSPEEVPYLTSQLCPSISVYATLPKVWRRMTSMRNALFRYFATLGEIETSDTDEALYTTVRMMKWGDMAHIPIITDFLNKYPAAKFFPDLEPSFRHYQASIRDLLDTCPEITDAAGRIKKGSDGTPLRDTSMMPYIKIFYGDRGDIALRKDMEPLIAVAHATLSQADKNMAGYVPPAGYGPIISKFKTFMQNLEEYTNEQDRLEVSKADKDDSSSDTA